MIIKKQPVSFKFVCDSDTMCCEAMRNHSDMLMSEGTKLVIYVWNGKFVEGPWANPVLDSITPSYCPFCGEAFEIKGDSFE